MEEIKTLEYFCGRMTNNQIKMVQYSIKNDFLFGIGRATGRSVYMPLVSKDGVHFDVIDSSGYYQQAAIEGRRSLENILKTYSWEVQ